MFTRRHSTPARYIFTAALVTLSTFLRFALAQALGPGVPFILYYPTVVLCAWFGGLWPGLLSTALGGLLAWYLFIPLEFSFAASDATAPAQLVTFLLAGVLISFLAESLHKARRETEESEAHERERREELRVTLASIGDAVITTDALCRVTFMNKVAELLTGWKHEEASGRALEEVFHIVNEQTREQAENPAQKVVEKGIIMGLANHTVLISKDGVERPIDDSAAPIRDKDNRLAGVVLIFRDISERRRSELALAQLGAIVESSEDAIVGKNLDGVITNWNAGAERVFGYSAEEAIGRNITMLIPPDRLSEETIILQKLRRGEPVEHYETVRMTKDGRQIFISLSVSPIKNKAGEVVGAAKIARDITERKRIEESLRATAVERERLLEREQAARAQAEEANRMKDEFLATVSHELRSPLHGMLGWVKLLQAGKLGQEEATRALDAIERNARSQAQLIEDLLEVSRIVAGKMRLDVRPVDLAATMEAAIESIRPTAAVKGVRLQTILDPLAGPISGDAQRLQQVVWNLLSNAVKFTPKGGRVQVLLRRANSHVEIVVSDTGQGISPEFLPHVFERFQQASSGSTRKHGGLGLGLAIVRHLVELHGGAVRAESLGEGQGATFVIDLPMMIARQTVPAIEQDGGEFTGQPTLDGLRVLVLDDDAEARDLLGALLKGCAATVYAAGSAANARRILETDHVDVILSDIEMPEEDGYSFIRSVRAIQKTRTTPAVAITAYARSEDRTRAMLAGFQFHLPKPVEPAELIAVVANLTGRAGQGIQD